MRGRELYDYMYNEMLEEMADEIAQDSGDSLEWYIEFKRSHPDYFKQYKKDQE